VCDACLRRARRAPPRPPPAGIDWWVSCFTYDGVVRELVARAKYRHARASIPTLAVHVASAVQLRQQSIDLVTWIPASRQRRHIGGVDHGELLARAVAAHLRLPVRRLLRRTAGRPQTGRDAYERRSGPILRGERVPAGTRVLVVDDVTTTGGSLAAAARTLRAQGVSVVSAATIAQTV
jgi:predicted amidophosphoribosyltransferase